MCVCVCVCVGGLWVLRCVPQCVCGCVGCGVSSEVTRVRV